MSVWPKATNKTIDLELSALVIFHYTSYCSVCKFRETDIEHFAANPALLVLSGASERPVP